VNVGEDQAQGRAVQADNRTRDHLANERTFLAWIRTGLGLIGFGFVLARMGLFLRQLAFSSALVPPAHHTGGHEFMVTGMVFLLLGTALCAWSARLYQRARRGIDSGHYEPAHREVVAISLIVALAGLTVSGLVLWRTLSGVYP
jgi:putative membrane protein